MSLSKLIMGKPNSNTLQHLVINQGGGAAAPSSSSSLLNFPPIPLHERSKPDSDEDLFRVPDVEATPISVHSGGRNSSNDVNQSNVTDPQLGKRRRGRNSVDKEYRRLKRDVPNLPYRQPLSECISLAEDQFYSICSLRMLMRQSRRLLQGHDFGVQVPVNLLIPCFGILTAIPSFNASITPASPHQE
ncbi:hypothetical protein VNO77_19574 [Canavalia gladiata]|uniref:Uncharacterized protein n=1 Tax=Canavalia gladiata TaxID=3824 RepID=A0AAN9LMS8_CANGL